MYFIYNYRKRRPHTNYIILAHAPDLIRAGTRIDPNITFANYKYTWGTWQKYWIRQCNKICLPCHYFCELVDKDYVIYNGLTEYKPSYFLEELCEQHLLPYKYRESILIVLGENFNVEPPERRMFDHLCDKVLSKLCHQYNLDFTRIRLLDECLVEEWEEMNPMIPVKDRWELQPIKYFNKVELKMSYNKYCVY